MAKNNSLDLTRSEKAIIKLIAAAFNGCELVQDEFNDLDWNEILNELKAQASVAVIFNTAVTIKDVIPDDVFDRWIAMYFQITAYTETILQYQHELCELFEQSSIPHSILKGTAAACYYPEPMSRNMGDIDVLVNAGDVDKALRLMLENGYELHHPIDPTDHHVVLKKHDIVYELHKEPSGIDEGKYGDMIRSLFENCCNDAEQNEIGGYRYYRLPRLLNGLVLLLHIVNHLSRGLGLRQICDWMAFVDRELSDDVWHNEFKELLEEIKLDTLACAVTKMCKLHLGLKKDITWCDNAKENTCNKLLRYVLDKGNFGHKDATYTQANVVLGEVNDNTHRFFIVNALINLQRSGIYEWEAVQRYPILKCLAWAYVPCRYIKRIITGERDINNAKQIMKAVSSTKNLKEELKVYE